MTTRSLSDFLGGYQRGIEVGVAATAAEELLGVREAFRRFFHDGIEPLVPVAVVAQDTERHLRGLAGSDLAAIESARGKASALAQKLGQNYQFYVGLEACIEPLDLEDGPRFLLRSWAVVVGPSGAALGASGSLELPARLVENRPPSMLLDTMPGTRRGGGLISSLTGGRETRRSAVAQATLNALSTLFYGILERRPGF